jgi:uncharacterized protein
VKTSGLGQAPLLAALALIFCFMGAMAHAAPSFPKLTGRVVDDANVLSPQTEATLTSDLAALEAKTGRQLVVVTLPSLQGDEISDYGYQLGRAWQIGQKGQNNGVLFIIAPNEHKVRIEVGYGLEPVLTDALSSVILQNAVLPKFREGDVQTGIVQGTNALVFQLSRSDDDAKAAVSQATVTAQAPHHKAGRFGIFPLLIFVFVIFLIFRAGGGPWLLPLLLSGGSGGGGGGGGGGFGGGGGSFGGGGSSGSW